MRFFRQRFGSIRRWYRRWKRRDTRPRDYGTVKWAIRRDGDYFLVECPSCHSQRLWFNKDRWAFECSRSYRCKTTFTVYTEDGVVELVDHRRGNVQFPARAKRDPGCGLYRLGIEFDAPWWWDGLRIERDLHGGWDAHRHQPYQIVGGTLEQKEEECERRH